MRLYVDEDSIFKIKTEASVTCNLNVFLLMSGLQKSFVYAKQLTHRIGSWRLVLPLRSSPLRLMTPVAGGVFNGPISSRIIRRLLDSNFFTLLHANRKTLWYLRKSPVCTTASVCWHHLRQMTFTECDFPVLQSSFILTVVRRRHGWSMPTDAALPQQPSGSNPLLLQLLLCLKPRPQRAIGWSRRTLSEACSGSRRRRRCSQSSQHARVD